MPTSPTSHKRPAEQGFGLIEVLIVMVILAILMAVAIPAYNSAKRAARYKDAVAAASSYRQAISSFQLDNGNLVPLASIPGAWAGGASPDPAGPKNILTKYYLRSGAPSEVAHKTLRVYGSGGASSVSTGSVPTGALASHVAAVQIAFPSAITFQLGVWTRDSSAAPWKLRCVMANTVPPAGTTPC
ncbi:MAG: type II secretion system protein [Thermoleophilia bacterium]|nr:type II secretion system protein [Thermoleophilia bacterium]